MREKYFHQTHPQIESKGGKFDNISKTEYSDEEYLRPLQDFFKEHKRPPTATEIDELSKKNLAPSRSAYWQRYGSLNEAFKVADMPEANKSPKIWEIGEIREKMKEYVKNFQIIHEGKFPTREDIKRDSVRGLCPPYYAISRHYKGLKRCYNMLFGKT